MPQQQGQKKEKHNKSFTLSAKERLKPIRTEKNDENQKHYFLLKKSHQKHMKIFRKHTTLIS